VNNVEKISFSSFQSILDSSLNNDDGEIFKLVVDCPYIIPIFSPQNYSLILSGNFELVNFQDERRFFFGLSKASQLYNSFTNFIKNSWTIFYSIDPDSSSNNNNHLLTNEDEEEEERDWYIRPSQMNVFVQLRMALGASLNIWYGVLYLSILTITCVYMTVDGIRTWRKNKSKRRRRGVGQNESGVDEIDDQPSTTNERPNRSQSTSSTPTPITTRSLRRLFDNLESESQINSNTTTNSSQITPEMEIVKRMEFVINSSSSEDEYEDCKNNEEEEEMVTDEEGGSDLYEEEDYYEEESDGDFGSSSSSSFSNSSSSRHNKRRRRPPPPPPSIEKTGHVLGDMELELEIHNIYPSTPMTEGGDEEEEIVWHTPHINL